MKNHVKNPRFFGSTIRGEDTEFSDLDILVDPIDGETTLISLLNIEMELSNLLGVKVDIQTPMSLSDRFRDDVVKSALKI